MSQPQTVGRPVAVTTGSNQVVLPRSGQLLGFFSSASQAVSFYDSNSATTPGTAFLVASACAVGWNPLPADLVNGLVINCASQLTAIVA